MDGHIRMVNDRLVWTLERDRLISEYQCGFRRGWSTLDHLVRFETFLRNAFIRKQHAVAVFFDLEKPYDNNTTWQYGILRDLYDLGIRGRLPSFIASFLSNQHFRVWIGTVLSNPHDQELGVPQGSVLSVTLFSPKLIIVACKHDWCLQIIRRSFANNLQVSRAVILLKVILQHAIIFTTYQHVIASF